MRVRRPSVMSAGQDGRAAPASCTQGQIAGSFFTIAGWIDGDLAVVEVPLVRPRAGARTRLIFVYHVSIFLVVRLGIAFTDT